MKKNKKNTILLLLGILALGLTLGYAYLNTTLNIDGTVNVSSANWDVYWDNIQYSSNNVTDVTTPATISTGKTEVAFNVNFKEPGDTYEFRVDAVNDGSIDAMIDTVTTGVYATNGVTEKEMPDYLDFTVTYSDGIEIDENQILVAGSRESYKVRVHYKEDISASQLPSTADNYLFKFRVTYVQKGPTGVLKPEPYIYTTSPYNNDGVLPLNYYDDSSEIDDPIFLRHKYVNNTITDSYVGFIINDQAYYLKGGDEGLSYDENKAILDSSIGSSNCSENNNYYYCSVNVGANYLTGFASQTGYVYALYGGTGCGVYANFTSMCGS